MGKAGEVTAWSEWRPLAGAPALGADVLAETLDGGQAFRWNRQADGTWLVPPGLLASTDEFGGVVGILRIE